MIHLLAELRFPGWDPVALHLGPIQVRWYGLGYLAAFLITGWILDRLGKDGFIALTKNSVSDLIGYLVLGVMLGGRFGYALFYERELFTHPLQLIQVWKGGLSFHGGLLGVVLASYIFALRRGLQWRRLADALSLCIPFGIILVRCANFINSELYGRIAPASLPWAVRFPTDPLARVLAPDLGVGGSLRWHEAYARLKSAGQWDRVAANIPLRHPSQLYEALAEGVLVALVLWAIYRAKGKDAAPGRYAAIFLLLYAVGRFLVEFTRQPDAQLGLVIGPFSMGQLLSVGVVAGAAAIYWWPSRNSSNEGL